MIVGTIRKLKKFLDSDEIIKLKDEVGGGEGLAAKLNSKFPLELHHVVPRSKGGGHGISNLVPLTRAQHDIIHLYLL